MGCHFLYLYDNTIFTKRIQMHGPPLSGTSKRSSYILRSSMWMAVSLWAGYRNFSFILVCWIWAFHNSSCEYMKYITYPVRKSLLVSHAVHSYQLAMPQTAPWHQRPLHQMKICEHIREVTEIWLQTVWTGQMASAYATLLYNRLYEALSIDSLEWLSRGPLTPGRAALREHLSFLI